MTRYGDQVLDELERFVAEVEQRTSAEIVLVLAHRAERYPDVPWACGSLAALVCLVTLVFIPVGFRAEWLPVDCLVAFGLGYLAGRLWAVPKRWLTSARRRTASVQRAAREAFTARGVSLTRERTGLLVFVAWLERRVEVVPDIGIERHLPLGQWNEARRRFLAAGPLADLPRSLPSAFGPLSDLLAEHLPRPADDVDEIPNRPVVLE